MFIQKFVKNPFAVIFVLIYLIGVYTHVVLYLSPFFFIPSIGVGIGGVLLLMKNVRRIRISHLGPILGVLTIGGLTVFWGPEASSYFGERVKGLAYLSYSMGFAYALFLELRQWERREVVGLFKLFSILIVVGCLLENYTSFRNVSDAFRFAVFRSGVYEGVDRDLETFGMIRPKLFTSEPSYVALLFLFFSTIWLGLSQERRKYLYHGLLTAMALFQIRSPIILLAAPIALVVMFYLDYGGLRNFLRMLGMRELAAVMLIALFVVTFLYVAFSTIMARRVQLILAGRGQSFAARIVAPPLIAYQTIKEYPVFGAGITGKEAIEEQMGDIFIALGFAAAVQKWTKAGNLVHKNANFFWLHWIYFGLLGGIGVLWLVYRLMKSLGVTHFYFCSMTLLIISQTTGGYVGTRTWTIVFMVFLVSAFRGTANNVPQIQNAPNPGSGAYAQ